MLLTCDSPKITTLKTNNHSSKEVNAHAMRCGLSLFVIVGVVVIPWTQQESITPFFLWYGYKKATDGQGLYHFSRGWFVWCKEPKRRSNHSTSIHGNATIQLWSVIGQNHQYQYAYIDINNKQVIPFGKYIWCDPQFTNNYARVKLKDNIHWGIIDNLGKIAIYPNLDYIAPLESFKSFGNYNAVKFTGRYNGEKVGYIIDHLSKVDLPIDFEFMSDFESEDILPSEQTDMKRRYFVYTSDENFNDSSWEDKENWEDQRLDAFEGDESNYWNID